MTKGKSYFMISCKDATDFVSRREEGRLSFVQTLRLRLHLLICKFCRRFSRQNRLLRRAAERLR